MSRLIWFVLVVVVLSAGCAGQPPLQVTTNSLPSAVVQQSYSAKLTAIGGISPFRWSILSGRLPSGLTLSANTGDIFGTPISPGDFDFTVGVASTEIAPPLTANQHLRLRVNPRGNQTSLVISTTILPSGTVQVPYTAALAATGGTQPYSWSVVAGSLPPGLALAGSTGAIAGTPSASGQYSFTVQVTDSATLSQNATKAFTLSIAAAAASPLQILTSGLPGGQVQASYTATLAATGGTQPYSWSVVAGSLPPGLALAGSTGAIAGTPSASGQYSFTVQVTDSATPSQNATKALTLTVSPSPAVSVSISPISATVGSGGTQQFTAAVLNTANAGVAWSVAGGGTISPSGLYTAPAVTANAMASVTATSVADATKSASATVAITVASARIATSLTLVPNVNPINQAAWLSLTAHVVYAGSVRPTGLITISEGPTVWNNGLTPVLDETWWTNILPVGSHSLVAKYSGDANYAASVSPVQVMSVAAPAPAPLQITTSSLLGGQAQASYSATLAGTGGTPPYSWSVVAGSLPPGLVLGGSTGVIAGTPSASGQYSFTVQATDSATPAQNATKAFSMSISAATPGPLQITTASLPGGALGVNYSATLAAANGVPPYTWSNIGGLLPPGLALQTSTGQISGNPTQAGAFGFLVQVKDSSGQVASSNFSVNIAPVSAPAVGSVSPNSGLAAGGTSVTITGTNFQAGASVLFGGVAALSATISSATRIQAITPAHAAGTVDVVVQNPDGQSSTLGSGFVYSNPAPTVASISPNSGSSAGGTSVSITGTNFLAGALVLFGTAPASAVTVNSATQIQAVTAANAAGAVDVTIQNSDAQSGRLASGFTYTAPAPVGTPTITSVSPNSGTPGTQVTINGTNFASGATVAFGTVNATLTTFVSPTQLTVSVPGEPAGVVDVKVTNPGGSSSTLPGGFTVKAPQSLLAGMTPSNFTVPAGWTLAATQDFESGSVGACQYLTGGSTNNGNITSAFSHGGTISLGVTYAHDGDQLAWGYGCLGSSKEFYLSYYDYGNGALFNEEYAIFNTIKRNLGGVIGFEQLSATLFYQLTNVLRFNEPNPQLQFGPQGNFVDFSNTSTSIATGYGSTGWNQWEVWERFNTPNTADGFIRVYLNGVLFMSKENWATFGPVDMTGAVVEAAGWYTKSIWTNNGLPPNAGGTCSPAPGIGGVPGAWIGSFSTVGASNCPPAPPIFNRYVDDIILMKK